MPKRATPEFTGIRSSMQVCHFSAATGFNPLGKVSQFGKILHSRNSRQVEPRVARGLPDKLADVPCLRAH
jgi:hypothetical protein